MKFKDKNGNIIYCKNDYYEEFDNNDFYYDASIEYYKGYLIHRDNGPAIEWNNGHEEWFLNGICYTKEEYLKIINLMNKKKVLDEI